MFAAVDQQDARRSSRGSSAMRDRERRCASMQDRAMPDAQHEGARRRAEELDERTGRPAITPPHA